MDHLTSVAHELGRQRQEALVNDAELLRRQAERAKVTDGGAVPVPSAGVTATPSAWGRLAVAWHHLLERAHIGRPVAH